MANPWDNDPIVTPAPRPVPAPTVAPPHVASDAPWENDPIVAPAPAAAAPRIAQATTGAATPWEADPIVAAPAPAPSAQAAPWDNDPIVPPATASPKADNPMAAISAMAASSPPTAEQAGQQFTPPSTEQATPLSPAAVAQGAARVADSVGDFATHLPGDVANMARVAGHDLHAMGAGGAAMMTGLPSLDEMGRPIAGGGAAILPQAAEQARQSLIQESAAASRKAEESAGQINNPVLRAVAPNVAPMATMMIPGGVGLAATMEAGKTYGETGGSVPRALAAGALTGAAGAVPIEKLGRAVAPVAERLVGKAAAPVVARAGVAAGVGGAQALGSEVSEKILSGKPIDWGRVLGGAGTMAAFDMGMQALGAAFKGRPIPQERIDELRRAITPADRQEAQRIEGLYASARRQAGQPPAPQAAPEPVELPPDGPIPQPGPKDRPQDYYRVLKEAFPKMVLPDGRPITGKLILDILGGREPLPANRGGVGGGGVEPSSSPPVSASKTQVTPAGGVKNGGGESSSSPPPEEASNGVAGGRVAPQAGDVSRGGGERGAALPGGGGAAVAGAVRPVEGAVGRVVAGEGVEAGAEPGHVEGPGPAAGAGGGGGGVDADQQAFQRFTRERDEREFQQFVRERDEGQFREFLRRQQGGGAEESPSAAAAQKEGPPVSTTGTTQVGRNPAGVPGEPARTVAQTAPAGKGRTAGRPRGTPFTKAAIERRLIDYHEQVGGGYTAADEAELNASRASGDPFTFRGRLPGEVRNYIESNPAARRLFRVSDDATRAGGEDAMASMGDRYWTTVGKLTGGKLAAAKETARTSGDPGIQFWAAVHDNLPPARQRPAQIGVDPATLSVGQEFELNGHRFQVVEDAEGYRMLRDGDDYPETPVDALAGQKIPVDKGTLRQGEEPAVPDDPFAGLPADDRVAATPTLPAAQSPTRDAGIFGQEVLRPATGSRQGGLFHEPADVATPEPDRVGASRNALDPRHTAEMFPAADGAAAGSPVDVAAGRRRRHGGYVVLPDAAKAAGKVATATQGLRDAVTVDAIPKLTRAGVGPEAVQHAKARDMVAPTVNDLLAKVFPESYKDKAAMARTVDLLVKDNILAGHDQAVERGDVEAARRIAERHDIDEYGRQVMAARFDPEVMGNIERWKKYVNPLLDRLYAQMKGLDPSAPQEGRGRHFGARINLLDEAHVPAWLEAMKDGTAPLPDEAAVAAAASPANARAKRDRFDRAASYVGKYSTDPETVLSAVLARRLNETTKLELYKAMRDKGLAVEVAPGDPRPETIGGRPAVQLPIAVPETNPETGHTRSVNKNLYVRSDLYGELRGVLGMDATPQNPVVKGIADALNKIQVAGVGDFVAHGFNINRVVGHALGEKSAAADALRRLPGVGSLAGLLRTMSVMRDIHADTPEIRAELAELTRRGLGRGYYPHGKWQLGGHVLTKMDQAARIVMNRYFDNLAERGLAKDTPENRYKFIAQVGEYNRRLIGPLSRNLRDSGFSPFVVAGKTMNRMGRRAVLGDPGFDAAGGAAWAKARALGLTSIVAAATMPMMLNALTTGSVMGRSGTPIGAWDTGHDNPDGTHRVVDLMQLTGARRGLRSMGLNAVLEGIQEGKDANSILGNAATDIIQSAAHPIIGPAPSFIFKATTGLQPDIRGHMDAQTMPEGKARQLVENTRAALESQQPLIYNLLRPAFRKAGIDQTPADKSYVEGVVGDGLAKMALSSGLGIKNARPGTDAAEDMAARLARARFGNGSPTPDDARKIAVKHDLLEALHAHPEMGAAVLAKSVEDGQLSEREAALLEKKAGMPGLRWNFRSLEPGDAAKVYALATPAERDALRDDFRKKVLASSLPAAAQDAMLAKAGVPLPLDIGVTRELHALNVREAAQAKALGDYRDAVRRAQAAAAAGDAAGAAKLRAGGLAGYKAALLTPQERARRARLQSIQRWIRGVQDRVRDGVMSQQEGDAKVKRYVALSTTSASGQTLSSSRFDK